MNFYLWALIAAISIGCGIIIVRYLVTSPMRMAVYLLLCASFVAVLALLVFLGLQGQARLAAAAVIFAGTATGYSAATAWFLKQGEERRLPSITPPPASQRNHTAVVYFTHGEPPAYSPQPWIETFKELDADKVSFIPTLLRPFFFLKFREEYLKVGGSPHNYIHQDMANSLKEAFRAEGDHKTRFYVAFLDSNPRPDEAAIRAVNEGANKVVFATVFVTVSSHTKAGQDMVREIELDRHGVPVCFSEPLWNSETLHEMFVSRANEHLNGMDKSKVGVLLVGHGQPPDWDKVYPTQTEHEILFRKFIIQRLVADGYAEKNICLAWMEYQEPKIRTVVKDLANQGVQKLFVFATSISASSLHSLHDIPSAVQEAGLPEGIEVVNLGAWDDDPTVIRAIKARVDACLGNMD